MNSNQNNNSQSGSNAGPRTQNHQPKKKRRKRPRRSAARQGEERRRQQQQQFQVQQQPMNNTEDQEAGEIVEDGLLPITHHHYGYFNNRSSSSSSSSSSSNIIIFCDMDGVLVDFNNGVCKVSGGTRADDMPTKQLWRTVQQYPTFFEDLDWTPDGRELWQAIAQFQPIMLTGVPSNKTDVIGRQKANWCQRELQCQVNHIDKAAHRPQRHDIVNNGRFRPGMTNVISCWTKFKHCECVEPGSILIDDRIKTKAAWENAGGIFVHHVNTRQTIAILTQLGIFQTNGAEDTNNPAAENAEAMIPAAENADQEN